MRNGEGTAGRVGDLLDNKLCLLGTVGVGIPATQEFIVEAV